jgi:hypothetical protein
VKYFFGPTARETPRRAGLDRILECLRPAIVVGSAESLARTAFHRRRLRANRGFAKH